MADFQDQLSIGVEVQLANARREYETFKREVESTPFKIASSFDIPSKENRTFGGMPGPTGPSVDVRPSQGAQTVLNSTQGAQVQGAFLHRTMGGSSFGPSTGPVGTAWQNGFYGDATKFIQNASVSSMAAAMSPMQPQAAMAKAAYHPGYGGYVQRAIAAGVMNPFSMSQFGQPGGLVLAERELNEWRQQKAANQATWRYDGNYTAWNPDRRGVISVPAGMGPRAYVPGPSAPTPGAGGGGPGAMMMPNLRGAFNAYTGIQMAGGAFAAQNQLAYAQIGALGNKVAYAQATIDNNPLANFVGSIPFGIGSGIVSAADYISQGRIDATRTLKYTDIQDRITGSLRSMGDARRLSAQSLQYAGAQAVGGFSAAMAGYQMMLANIEPNRQLQYASMSAPIQEKLAGANAGVTRLRGRLPSEIGITLPDGTETNVSMTFNSDGTANTGVPKGWKINRSDMARMADFNAAIGAQSDAKGQLTAFEKSTRDVAAQDEKALRMQKSVAVGLDRVSGSTIGMQSRLSTAQVGFAMSGNTAASIGAGIAAQFNPQINSLAGQMAVTAANGGSISMSQYMGYQSLLQGRTNAGVEAFTGYAGSTIGQLGSIRAAGLNLQYRPFEAQRAQAKAAFDSAMTVVGPDGKMTRRDASSMEGKLAQAQYDAEQATINQNERFMRRSLTTQLDAQSASLDYQFARNDIGAEAATFVGSTINQMRDLARSGFVDEAEQLRSNGLRGIRLRARDYALSFRAQQADLQNVMPFNPRDSQDPEVAFGSIRDQFQKLAGASATPDKNETVGGGIIGKVDQLEQNLPNIIRNAMRDVLAN